MMPLFTTTALLAFSSAPESSPSAPACPGAEMVIVAVDWLSSQDLVSIPTAGVMLAGMKADVYDASTLACPAVVEEFCNTTATPFHTELFPVERLTASNSLVVGAPFTLPCGTWRVATSVLAGPPAAVCGLEKRACPNWFLFAASDLPAVRAARHSGRIARFCVSQIAGAAGCGRPWSVSESTPPSAPLDRLVA